MLDRLVAVCIIAHVHHLHLSDFMDGKSVIAIIENRREKEYRVKHLVELLLSAHQTDESFRIVEYRPGIMPGISLGKGIAPLERIERRLEFSIQQSSAHQTTLPVEHLLIVHRSLGKRFQFLLRLAERLAKLVDAPVIIGIFQGTGHTFIDFHIIRHIAQLIVVLKTMTSGRIHFRMNSIGSMNHSLPKGLCIITT